jgi:SAM-dependent methyltransferase
MDNGWEASAGAWIADMGQAGDFGRRYVLDPVMLPRAVARLPGRVLDVGCGEGRFCRMLGQRGAEVTGIDPTGALIGAARGRDPEGKYVRGTAERLPFRDEAFGLVVSYLSLIDIPDFSGAIWEMARVLKPGGALLIANLNSFVTAGVDPGWVKNDAGEKLYYPIDRYLEERAGWIEYRGIRVVNHHRPVSAYFGALLGAGLQLTWFDEPTPGAELRTSKAKSYGRVPWFVAMEWVKSAGSGGSSVSGEVVAPRVARGCPDR